MLVIIDGIVQTRGQSCDYVVSDGIIQIVKSIDSRSMITVFHNDGSQKAYRLNGGLPVEEYDTDTDEFVCLTEDVVCLGGVCRGDNEVSRIWAAIEEAKKESVW